MGLNVPLLDLVELGLNPLGMRLHGHADGLVAGYNRPALDVPASLGMSLDCFADVHPVQLTDGELALQKEQVPEVLLDLFHLVDGPLFDHLGKMVVAPAHAHPCWCFGRC